MKRALIIEDNENNMELIDFILTANNYSTIKAFTGQEGFDVAVEKLPDFIILDIQLPDIIGTDVLKMLRAEEKTKEIPVIAMTSYAMAGDRGKLLKAGCNGYVEKPYDPATVMLLIEKVLTDK